MLYACSVSQSKLISESILAWPSGRKDCRVTLIAVMTLTSYSPGLTAHSTPLRFAVW